MTSIWNFSILWLDSDAPVLFLLYTIAMARRKGWANAHLLGTAGTHWPERGHIEICLSYPFFPLAFFYIYAYIHIACRFAQTCSCTVSILLLFDSSI
ncbi:hypothetical protein F5Y09DRAFT_300251 [Xylaria sp. FL1042]|nr:hypothetical protein F5Y09DRAFT_300251 [Xylaria sp. FL1042]